MAKTNGSEGIFTISSEPAAISPQAETMFQIGMPLEQVIGEVLEQCQELCGRGEECGLELEQKTTPEGSRELRAGCRGCVNPSLVQMALDATLGYPGRCATAIAHVHPDIMSGPTSHEWQRYPEGAVLRNAREGMHLSLRDMSERIGYSKQYLWLIERGQNPITRAIAEGYEQACGLQPTVLTALIPDPATRNGRNHTKS